MLCGGESARELSHRKRERESAGCTGDSVCVAFICCFFFEGRACTCVPVCVRAKFRFHFHFDGVSRRLFRCLFAIGKQRKRERRAEAEANKMAPNNITTHTKKKL